MNNSIPDDFVKLEQHVCPVCGDIHTHDCGILMHKNLKAIPEGGEITGWGMCKEHDDLRTNGFIALIACSNTTNQTKLKPENAERTGEIAHIKRDVFEKLFDVPVPEAGMCFVEPEVIDYLKQMMEEQL